MKRIVRLPNNSTNFFFAPPTSIRNQREHASCRLRTYSLLLTAGCVYYAKHYAFSSAALLLTVICRLTFLDLFGQKSHWHVSHACCTILRWFSKVHQSRHERNALQMPRRSLMQDLASFGVLSIPTRLRRCDVTKCKPTDERICSRQAHVISLVEAFVVRWSALPVARRIRILRVLVSRWENSSCKNLSSALPCYVV